jgi:hypothetical protein
MTIDKQIPDEASTRIAELDEPADPGVDGAWLDEAERRDREIECGRVQTASGDEVFRDAARLLQVIRTKQ